MSTKMNLAFDNTNALKNNSWTNWQNCLALTNCKYKSKTLRYKRQLSPTTLPATHPPPSSAASPPAPASVPFPA